MKWPPETHANQFNDGSLIKAESCAIEGRVPLGVCLIDGLARETETHKINWSLHHVHYLQKLFPSLDSIHPLKRSSAPRNRQHTPDGRSPCQEPRDSLSASCRRLKSSASSASLRAWPAASARIFHSAVCNVVECILSLLLRSMSRRHPIDARSAGCTR